MTLSTSQTFEPDGRAVPFAEEGEGPVKVVLLPGRGLGISSLGTLSHVLEEEGFHLLRIGVRANADGAVPTMHDLARDVVDVMDHVGMDSAWIGGHAFGGALARTVALDHPEHTEGVILVGVQDLAPLAAETAAAFDAAFGPEADDDAEGAAALLAGPSVDPAFAGAVLTRHRDAAAGAVQVAALAATPAEEWSPLAPNFAVLVVQGTDDPVTTLATAEWLQASEPQRVSLTRVDGAGHLGVLTHAGEVGFAIEDYLAWD